MNDLEWIVSKAMDAALIVLLFAYVVVNCGNCYLP